MDTSTMTKSDLDRVADLVAERVAEKILRELKQDGSKEQRETYREPETMDFGTACQVFFKGHSREWAKYWVLHKHPEITKGPNAWITPARGRGAKIQVLDVDKAKKWMKAHGQTINWSGKEPRTLMAHGQL